MNQITAHKNGRNQMTSIRLTDDERSALDFARGEMSISDFLMQAVWQQQHNIRVGEIEWEPYEDPIARTGAFTRTMLVFDPEDRIVYVEQMYGNQTSMAIYNRAVLAVTFSGNPSEDDIREFIRENSDAFARVADGFTSDINARGNLEGYLNDDAEDAWASIEQIAENVTGMILHDAGDWLEMLDEDELREMISEFDSVDDWAKAEVKDALASDYFILGGADALVAEVEQELEDSD